MFVNGQAVVKVAAGLNVTYHRKQSERLALAYGATEMQEDDDPDAS
jgi:hypothetical protein